jgi:NAD(P)-dependent dehydrogenase (short-subunit alcohol dehydrogenase family)
MSQAVALITAGAGGLGLCIARQFSAEGYRVHVCDVDAGALEEFRRVQPDASATQADVSDKQQVEQLFNEVRERYGRLDVLVNNAGISGPVARVEDIDPHDWDRTIAVDLSGAFYVTRLAVPLLRVAGKGSSIINIASTAGQFGCPLRSPYTASKWALIGLTKTWAMELGAAGIRVNAICPGCVSGKRIESVIERDALERGCSTEEVRRSWTNQTSMHTFVDAEDVAEAASFLASAKARFISGQVLGVDGHTESLSSPLD